MQIRNFVFLTRQQGYIFRCKHCNQSPRDPIKSVNVLSIFCRNKRKASLLKKKKHKHTAAQMDHLKMQLLFTLMYTIVVPAVGVTLTTKSTSIPTPSLRQRGHGSADQVAMPGALYTESCCENDVNSLSFSKHGIDEIHLQDCKNLNHQKIGDQDLLHSVVSKQKKDCHYHTFAKSQTDERRRASAKHFSLKSASTNEDVMFTVIENHPLYDPAEAEMIKKLFPWALPGFTDSSTVPNRCEKFM